MKKYLTLTLLLSLAIGVNSAHAFIFNSEKKRDHIYMVGSSTVSPLAASVAEEFSRSWDLKGQKVKTPIIKSTGTTKGFELFCAGIGKEFPDFNNASRKITQKEIELCEQNGIRNIVEIKIGYDGIVVGDFNKISNVKFTKEHIFLALAEKVFDKKTKKIIPNPYISWHEIDEDLPNLLISIYGPPKSSGTRDVFVDMVLEEFCMEQEAFIEGYPKFSDRKTQCDKIRTDGKFIESGENDDLIISHLKRDHNAFGIFGFNFLISNKNVIKAVKIDGVNPSFTSISRKIYPLSRPLFIYFKKDHLDMIDKMPEFISEIINDETIGKKGYLAHGGLVPLTNVEAKKVRKRVSKRLNLGGK